MTSLSLADLRKQFYGDADDELATLQSLVDLGASFDDAISIKKIKTADTPRLNDTTAADDLHLVFPALPVGMYILDGMLVFEGSTTGDLKFGFSNHANITLNWVFPAQATGATTNTGSPNAGVGTSGTFNRGTIGAGTPLVSPIYGALEVVTAATDFKAQWAQAALDAVVPTILKKFSWLRLQKVS